MKLSTAARYFDKTTFYEGYNNSPLFKGRLLPFEDSTRDSTSVERRLLSVPATAVIPSSRAVKASSTTYLVGDGTDDLHYEEVLRRKYVLHAAQEQAQIRTFTEALSNTGTKQAWAARSWVKGNKEQNESSGVFDGYNLFFSSTEVIRSAEWGSGSFFDGYEDNLLIKMLGSWHIVRSAYSSIAGFQVVTVDELPEPVLTTVSLVNRVYNLKTGTYTETPATVPAINIRWQSSFAYRSADSAKYERGDAQVVIAKGATAPKAGDFVTIAGRSFRVVTVYDQQIASCWRLHLRRHV